jgi:xanthosine utilization system XapX-like protein
MAQSKMSLVGELWAFLKVRKKWWLGPIIAMLILLGFLIVFTESSALAPFIYAIF